MFEQHTIEGVLLFLFELPPYLVVHAIFRFNFFHQPLQTQLLELIEQEACPPFEYGLQLVEADHFIRLDVIMDARQRMLLYPTTFTPSASTSPEKKTMAGSSSTSISR